MKCPQCQRQLPNATFRLIIGCKWCSVNYYQIKKIVEDNEKRNKHDDENCTNDGA